MRRIRHARPARLFLFRFEQELYSQVDMIERGVVKSADKARSVIRDNLTQLSQILVHQKFLLAMSYPCWMWRLHRCYGARPLWHPNGQGCGATDEIRGKAVYPPGFH